MRSGKSSDSAIVRGAAFFQRPLSSNRSFLAIGPGIHSDLTRPCRYLGWVTLRRRLDKQELPIGRTGFSKNIITQAAQDLETKRFIKLEGQRTKRGEFGVNKYFLCDSSTGDAFKTRAGHCVVSCLRKEKGDGSEDEIQPPYIPPRTERSEHAEIQRRHRSPRNALLLFTGGDGI